MRECWTKLKLNPSLTTCLHHSQSYDSLMCGFYCIAFIEYITGKKTLWDSTKLFFANDFRKNGKIMYKYFKDKYSKPRL